MSSTNKVHLKILTQTATRTFRKCQRLYYYLYIRLNKPTQVSDPLTFGTVWHDIRESWWKAQPDIRLEVATNKLIEITSNPESELDEFVIAKLSVMLRGYHMRWIDFVNSLVIIGVEQSFDLPIVNPRSGKVSRLYRIQGKIDSIIEFENRLWVVEEKTAAEDLKPESPYWRKLEIDPQCSVYYHAVQALYKNDLAGIMYFVNIKPPYRPLKKTENPKYTQTGLLYKGQREEDENAIEYTIRLATKVSENPERFYQMVRVARLERDIRESQIDIWDTAKAIREAELHDVWLRNPDACIHPFGSVCAFMPVCTNRANIEDTSMYRTADTAHEELNDEKTL